MVRRQNLVCFGGWYQRTTLHLTEIYEFLSSVNSRLNLNPKKLKELHKKLDLISVKRKVDYLEYVEIETSTGIVVKYYEDGLYVIQVNSSEIDDSKRKIKDYFNDRFKPAMDYLFSLGAPTPKILANIKEEHPIVVGIATSGLKSFRLDKKFGRIYSEASSRDARVFKTDRYIVVVSASRKEETLSAIIHMQMFFREFKTQLHKYLNIHRKIWEDISKIKERQTIRGIDISKERAILDSYQKTIHIITNRINQMGTYAKTRASLSKRLRIEKDLKSLFEYRYEDLFNTLDYIKEMWKMTSDYLDSAIKIINEVQGKASGRNIKSIQLLASIGVITGLMRYANIDSLPIISKSGAIYLIGLGLIAFGADWFLTRRAKRKEYKLKFVERDKGI